MEEERQKIEEEMQRIARISLESVDSRVTIDYMPRRVTMRYVSDQELETIGSSTIQSAIHLAFFGLAGGAALALGVTLNTVTISDPKTYAAYWGAFALSLLCTAYFGLRAFSDYRQAKRQLKAVREETPARGQAQ